MIIHLPFPNPELNPNRSFGKHWSVSAKLKQQSYQDAFHLTRLAMQKQLLPESDTYTLEIIFIAATRRKIDLDNCLSSAKNLLDGVAAALKINDRQFEPIILRRSYEKDKAAMIVEICVEETLNA